jgi:two-component system, LytTR family, sensor kinase
LKNIKHIRYHLLGWSIAFLISITILSNLTSIFFAFLQTLFNLFFLIFLFYFNTEVLVKKYYENGKRNQYILLLCLTSVVVMIARLLFARQFDPQPFTQIVYPKFRFLSFIVISTALSAVFSSFYQLFQNRNEKEKQHLQIIAEQKEAQLQFLRGQMNPHFLFNTLNNLYSLSISNSPETPRLILQLSDLLRYVIYDSQKEKINITNEIQQIERFISLFQMRFQNPKNIEFNVIKKASISPQIEPMVLIPLVENCLKHTDLDTNINAWIVLRLEIWENKLIFQTQNTFNAIDKQKDKVGGVGLANIKKRLDLTYQSNYSLIINQKEGIYETLLTLNFE